MNRKQKKRLYRILAAAVLYAAALILTHGEARVLTAAGEVLFIAAYLTVGLDILMKAVRNIGRGKLFDENFLMSLATIGAFAIRQFPEAAAVMLFYQVGELFQDVAVDHSRRSISAVMDIRPDYANLMTPEGEKKVDPDEVKVGDLILVKPGERIPLDGEVTEGESLIDTAALTGEPVPRTAKKGDLLLSGCINKDGVLTVKITKPYGDSTVSKILDLVENASSRKSESEAFITRFSAVYTPAVVFSAIALAFLPPLFIPGHPFSVWIYRALTFLVVSCPCALVISIPLSFFGGIGGASKKGILVKGSNYLEALSKAEIAVFDKTGTLTEGIFEVREVRPAEGFTKEELLKTAAYAEYFSNHPIAVSIKKAYGEKIDPSVLSDAAEEAGHGIAIRISGKKVLAGNLKLMKENGMEPQDGEITFGTVVHVAEEGRYAGSIVISDRIKGDAAPAMKGLKANGIRRTVMLTGDRQETAEAVAEETGVDEFHAELLPADKVDLVEKLIGQKSKKGKLVFVGDGINDAPVLARADIGIAMGGLGSDAAIEAADIVIMTDEPSKLVTAMRISRKTLKIANENTVFAIAVKLLVLVLGALGLANMWEAVFADVGVAVIAILNSMRNLKTDDV
jgi:Cd2+/Zn2+-exporting ATPase